MTRFLARTMMVLCAFTMPMNAFAQDAAPSAPKAEAAAKVAPITQEIQERRTVAYVSSAVSLVTLAGGITMGVLANQQFTCLQDVATCNSTLAEDEKISGDVFLDAVTEVEHKSLIADMLYLASAASAIVAVTSVLRGFIFTGEGEEALEEEVAQNQVVLPTFAFGAAQ